MKIFISYASEHFADADQLASSLRNERHVVFVDRERLHPGSAYDNEIRRSIVSSDLFIFLVSPESVQEGRYTLTELSFARERWKKTHDNILPVMIAPTPILALPGFLRSVSVLTPAGKFIPEVLAQVRRIAAGRRKRHLLGIYAPSLAGVIAIAYLTFSNVIPGGKEFIRQYIYRDVSRSVLESHILENLKDDNFCETAAINAQRLVEQYPDYARGYRHLGVAYYCLRKFDLAVTAFENALKIEPASIDYKYGLAANLALSGSLEKANALYAEVIAHYQKSGTHYSAAAYSVALNTAAARHYEEALTLFRKLQWDPSYGDRIRVGALLCQIALADEEAVKSLVSELVSAASVSPALTMVIRGVVPPGRAGTEFIPLVWIVEGLGKRKDYLNAAITKSSSK
jgi:hypothetical protein